LYYDFLFLLDWSVYWDGVEQILQLYPEVPKPPKRILWDPEKFNRWVKWAKDYDKKEQDGRIAPFGFVCQDEEDYYEFFS
jgi:hypothetical protein